MKDMMFQRRQDSNRMLWSVRNAEFVERGNWRLGRDGLGIPSTFRHALIQPYSSTKSPPSPLQSLPETL
uniref:Uncharacterized protein n=1 Tax=Magallana gigas TaxID=29159 RepID=K1Q955_MAGGI